MSGVKSGSASSGQLSMRIAAGTRITPSCPEVHTRGHRKEHVPPSFLVSLFKSGEACNGLQKNASGSTGQDGAHGMASAATGTSGGFKALWLLCRGCRRQDGKPGEVTEALRDDGGLGWVAVKRDRNSGITDASQETQTY